MQHYIAFSICIVILSVTGCLDGLCGKLAVNRRDIAFAALCVAAFSSFRLKPVAELDIDASVLALPVAFMLLGLGRKPLTVHTLRLFALSSLLPPAVCAAYMLYCFISTRYASYVLRAESICAAQLAVTALTAAILTVSRPSRQSV